MMQEKWQRLAAAKTLFGLGDHASLQEVKAAYRRLCKECHPDRQVVSQRAGSPMQEVNAAYAVLLDYCQTFRVPLTPAAGGQASVDPEEWWFDRFGEDPLWGRRRG